MKKLFKTFGLMSMAALLAVSTSSCKKTEDEGAEFMVSLSQVEGFEAGDRAYIDINNGGALTWNEGDQIMIYNLANDYTKSVARIFTAVSGSEGQTVTRFKGRAVGAKKDIGYFYFYPAEKASGTLQEDNRETFTVRDTQVYDPTIWLDSRSLVMACTVNAISDNFVMEHIFGVLNVRMTKTSPARIRSIVVTDRVFNLAGTMSLKLPEVDKDKLDTFVNKIYGGETGYETQLATYLQELGYEPHGNNKTLTLDCSQCDNNQGMLVDNNLTYFFIPIRPGALYKGFDITVNYMDSSDPTELHYEPLNTFCTRPGKFTNVNVGI